jgi:FkbM family methyltransferase
VRRALVRMMRLLRDRDFRGIYRRLYWRSYWRIGIDRPFVSALSNTMPIRLAHTSASSGIFINGGASDPAIQELFCAFVRPRMVFFDCGAHIGEYTLLCAGLVRTDGHVHAFEPDPRVFSYLEENVRNNALTNVVLNRFALADSAGYASFVLHEDATSSGLRDCATGVGVDQIKVATMTLDDYVEMRRVGRIDAIKIDVEGAEAALVMGAGRTFASLRPGLVFIECHDANRVGELVERFRGLGYETSVMGGGEQPHIVAQSPKAEWG